MACFVLRPHRPLSLCHRSGSSQWQRRRTVASLFDDMLAQSFSDSDFGLFPGIHTSLSTHGSIRTSESRDRDEVWNRHFVSVPRTENVETENAWHVQVEVPGIAADSIKVDFDTKEGTLIIAGTSRQSLRAQHPHTDSESAFKLHARAVAAAGADQDTGVTNKPQASLRVVAESDKLNSASESVLDGGSPGTGDQPLASHTPNPSPGGAVDTSTSTSTSASRNLKGSKSTAVAERASTFSYRYNLGFHNLNRVDKANITPKLHNGLLTVTVPKKMTVSRVANTIQAIPITTSAVSDNLNATSASQATASTVAVTDINNTKLPVSDTATVA